MDHKPSHLFNILTLGSGLFLYSMIVFLLGVILPQLSAKFDLTDSQKGQLFLVLNSAIFIAVVLSGPFFEKVNKRFVLLTGIAMLSVLLPAIGCCGDLHLCMIFLFFLGLAAGVLNIGCNTLIPVLFPQNSAAAFSLANVFFGLGGIVLPLFGTLYLSQVGLPRFMIIIAGFALPALMLFMTVSLPARGETKSTPIRFDAAFMRNRTFILLGLVFLCYGALEVSTAGWLKMYCIQSLSYTEKQAGTVLIIFSLMLLVGRFIAGWLLQRVSCEKVVLASALLAVVGLAVMALAHQQHIVYFGIIAIGLAYAPIFPASLGFASKTYLAQRDAAIGFLLAAGVLGGVLLPFFIGLFGGDIRMLILFAIFLVGTQFLLIIDSSKT